MYMGKQHSEELKQQVLQDIKNGARVAAVCEERALSSKTVYKWLRNQADNTGTSSLEVARLRKENQELKELVGLFALQKKRAEKNTRSS
jgi:transposase-like protein